jgi:hypothetical protein
MKKVILLALILISEICFAGQNKKVVNFYDDTETVYDFSSHERFKKLSSYDLIWQLTTLHRRILRQGRIVTGQKMAIPLLFDTLKPGVSLKLLLEIKGNSPSGYKTVMRQPLTVYSKNIFAGKVKKAGAILPNDVFDQLEAQGLKLEKMSDFDDSAKLVFCEAKDYAENPDLLTLLMNKKMTLVMFAPDNKTEIYLPTKKIRQINHIFPPNAKIAGTLSVISNKEKVLVNSSGGNGALVDIKYLKGEIIIVSDAMRKALDKEPDAALLLIRIINSNIQQEKEK